MILQGHRVERNRIPGVRQSLPCWEPGCTLGRSEAALAVLGRQGPAGETGQVESLSWHLPHCVPRHNWPRTCWELRPRPSRSWLRFSVHVLQALCPIPPRGHASPCPAAEVTWKGAWLWSVRHPLPPPLPSHNRCAAHLASRLPREEAGPRHAGRIAWLPGLVLCFRAEH